MLQQRLTERLIGQWRLMKDESACPDFSRFNKSALADVWDSCLLVKIQPKVEGSVARYQYVDVGKLAAGIFRENPVGTYFTAAQKVMPAARLVKRIEELAPTSEPIMDDGQFVNEKNKVVKFRSCLVPFGSVEGITHVVVGLSWREF